MSIRKGGKEEKVNKIKFYRKKNNITLRQLSEKAKVSLGYICDLENKTETNPSKEIMIRIAKALDSNVQAVFFTEDD